MSDDAADDIAAALLDVGAAKKSAHRIFTNDPNKSLVRSTLTALISTINNIFRIMCSCRVRRSGNAAHKPSIRRI